MFANAIARLKHWLMNEKKDQRRAERALEPEIVVHYWDGPVPAGRSLRDINRYGAYIYSTERWYPGTIIRLVVQGYRTDVREEGRTIPTNSFSVNALVVRHGEDGVGVEFIFPDERTRDGFQSFLDRIPSHAARAAAGRPAPRQTGQALIEFALIVPLVFILAVNAINFAGFIFAWITVAGAARDGAQYMVRSSASPGAPTSPTSAQVTTLVTSDVTSLKNRASIVVAVCTNATTSANGCTTYTDPEAPSYTLATVDVTYTYTPYIPLFTFPGLGIAATLPSGTIHRKAVMRMLQ